MATRGITVYLPPAVIPFPAQRPARPVVTGNAPVAPRYTPTPSSTSGGHDIPRGQTPGMSRPSPIERVDRGGQDLSDMEIPTFIRRQMD